MTLQIVAAVTVNGTQILLSSPPNSQEEVTTRIATECPIGFEVPDDPSIPNIIWVSRKYPIVERNIFYFY